MSQEVEPSEEQGEGGDEDKAAYATAQRFESKAQLKPFQREAVQEVAKHAKWRPMPRMSTEGEKEEGEPTERQSGKAGGPHGIDARSIATKEEFDAWYADLQRRRREADEAKYRRYAERLREQAEACGRLVDMTERCSEDFSDLEREHAGVGKHVEGLSAHCERLATERDRLEGYAGALRERLSYFDGLEQAASELRRASPSDAKGFTRLMARIEECAEYVGRNPQYVDAGEYAARFKQLRAKALGSVKSFASASLRKASQAAKHEGSRSVERQRAAFRAELPDLAPVAKEIANRRSRQPEYAQLARDLAEAFCDNRASSLESIAREHAEELARDGLERLAREGPSFFASLVEREREVLAAFLGSTELSHDAPLNRLAEPLGNALYDAFRPRLVATDSVDRLCAVAEAVVSGPLGGDLAAHPQESSQLAEPLARKLLGDARERLAFRAQALVRSAFAKHKPDPSSLSLPSPEKPGVGSFSPVDQAMDLLPRLASVLEAWVFAGLAQEAILRVSEACHAATKALESSGKPRADAELFSIAQLLRLRSALSHLEATPSPGPSQAPSLDFSHLRQELSRLLPLGSKSRRLHDEDGEGGTGTPSNPAAASSSGLLQELDSRLQVACESYIMSTTQLLLEPLLTFTSKASASRDQGASLRSRAFGHPDRVAEAVSRARSSLQSHLPAAVDHMKLYVTDEKSRDLLLKPLKGNIMEARNQMESLIAHEYTAEEASTICLMSADELQSMLDKMK